MKIVYQPLETLQDIKSMMERSSRFISLSGWSGVSAGVCALIGAWLAVTKLTQHKMERHSSHTDDTGTRFVNDGTDLLSRQLIIIAAGVFIAAFLTSFLFTYFRSKRFGIKIWGTSARRLMWNTLVPMIVGGVVVLRMLDLKYFC